MPAMLPKLLVRSVGRNAQRYRLRCTCEKVRLMHFSVMDKLHVADVLLKLGSSVYMSHMFDNPRTICELR